MANFIKQKISISLLSISFIILIHLIESNFNAPVTMKRWSKLTWDDFQGIAQPFTRFDARIGSGIFLEYTTTDSSYHAYAAQNNIRSWVRKSSTQSDYLLNHEQYHFNISELHARLLNNYIKGNPDENEYAYILRLESIKIDLGEMQRRYDAETNHSTISDKQRRWEYKIDSLLTLDSGWVTDYFSGAKIYFPAKPHLTKGLNGDKSPYRKYSLNRYDMSLSLVSFQLENTSDTLLQGLSKAYRKKLSTLDSTRIMFVTLDTLGGQTRVNSMLKDSSNYTYRSIWLNDSLYLYQITVNYPNNTGDTTGYSQIAMSFINSFSVLNTDEFWVTKREKATSPIIHSTIVKVYDHKNDNSVGCLVHRNSKPRGFYRGPLYQKDGSILIAYDNIEHADSLLLKNVLVVGGDLYSFAPDTSGLVYSIPGDKLPRQPFRVDFGYLLVKDTINVCPELYYQTLEIDPFETKSVIEP